ncbi:MAG: ATP-dependent helicase [Pseudonocardiales bacterium]|nr:ATP-dependent helicase [Pseudonocardiales bacterium]MBV9031805.1 ATP-dependent helicase [Pseudonocardiales bacterium]
MTAVRAGRIGPEELAEELGIAAPTAAQAEVIAADPGGPTLVVAGAGSGKTETMAARVVWLVANGYVTPEGVLGLTFTRKAAQQLAERVRARLRRLAGSAVLDRLDPTGQRRAAVLPGEATVLTYHAYAGRLVAEHALRLPTDPGARLLTETGAWQLAHRVTAGWEQDLDLDGKVPRTVTGWVLGLAGQLAEHLCEPARLRESTEAMIIELLAAAPSSRQRGPLSAELRPIVDAQRSRLAILPLVERYTELKRREAVLDFGDQMGVAAMLARDHPEVGAAERARFGAVLLDEYQDTGHAQRVLLRSLFGGAVMSGSATSESATSGSAMSGSAMSGSATAGRAIPVTAVGDPCQSIYGWRGACAANLPRFTTDFPGVDGTPAVTRGLLTSFRNPPEVLAVANAVSGELRGGPVRVGELRCRDGAQTGEVRAALLPDVRAEVNWVAAAIAERWHSAVADGSTPLTAAVLVRRRADMAALAAALRSRDVPVEVVGLGGLLATAEVRDLVSVLRLLVDPLAGTAAARLLTGARWRIGATDLAALWERAREQAPAALPDELPREPAEGPGLVDALDSPGDPARYSELGYQRLRMLAAELRALRRRVTAPLTDLVADAERTLLLDTESLARPGPAGRAHLDAFADLVADFAAASPLAGLPALLDYLATAEEAEDGLEPGEVEVAHDRVQILTVHAAKGLEWRVVAVPHLVEGVFPAAKKSSSWLRTVTELPVPLRGDRADLPGLALPAGADQKELAEALSVHEAAFDTRRLTEERRLLYVALTRAEQTLLVSGHHWGEAGSAPRSPSEFLLEIRDVEHCVVDQWAAEPGESEPNPLDTAPPRAIWPADPLGARRDAVAEGAQLVRDALTLVSPGSPGSLAPVRGAQGWQREIDVLLAERDARRAQSRVVLPAHLSVSQLVELAGEPSALAARLRRPLPFAPNPMARRGTAFHAWLERRFGSTRLIDHDELPGAADEGAAPNIELSLLQAAFLASEWAARSPHDVEVPFETVVDGVGVRGRMDAVFADADGGWTVVDWKTGTVPDEVTLRALSVQLAAYRLAWSALSAAPLSRVRAAFHYIRDNHTVRPADLLDAEGLRDLLRSVPVG